MRQVNFGRGGSVLVLQCLLSLGIACATSKDAQSGAPRVAPSEPWRDVRPAAEAAPVLTLPTFQKVELKNGMVMILVEDHSLPTVHASVVIKAGASLDGKEPGLSELTYDLIDEGAGSFNAPALSNAFADIGSVVKTWAQRESGRIQTKFLTRNADKGLELLSLVAQKPTFAPIDFERVKNLHLDALRAKEGDPDAVCNQVLTASVFGADHAYGKPADGTISSVEKLRQSSAKKFWSDFVGPKNAALVLVGDLTLDDAKTLAEKHFGKWKGGGKAGKAPVAPKARTALNIYVVDFPGAPQTQIRIARALIAAGDPDEPALTVMNQVLGGMFTSRLNLKLREEKHWTYGAFSDFETSNGPGIFVMGADVQTPATGDALKEIFDQLDVLRTSGVTQDELALAKANFVKSIPARFSLPPLQARVAAGLFELGLPLDHIATQLVAVNAVTVEAVKKVTERAIVKEDFVVVLVGDRAAIEAGLKDKNLGAMVFLNKDGSVAK